MAVLKAKTSNEGIEIAIYKEGDANAVNVAQKVANRLNEVNNNLPSNYTLSEIYDQSVFIKQAIDNVKSAAVMGGILAMLVLYLFLKDFWATVIISVSQRHKLKHDELRWYRAGCWIISR